MGNITHVIFALKDALESATPETAVKMLLAAGVPADTQIELFEGDLDLLEALQLAKMLREIGDLRADELYAEIFDAAFCPTYGMTMAGPAAVA